MWLEDQLRALITKTASDFDETAAKERVIESVEDGTTRGDTLDHILVSQKTRRDELWNRLHQLEDRLEQEGMRKVATESQESDEKRAAIYLHEEEAVLKEIKKQESVVNVVHRDQDEILEIQFRHKLEQTIRELQKTHIFVDREIRTTQEALDREQQTLDECDDIATVLAHKVATARNTTNTQDTQTRLREQLRSLREKHRMAMSDLIDFLDLYYPPHTVDALDEESESTDTCELKFILEDLMNLSIMNPGNPFLDLLPGTYWSPYIETLVKAGIAERDIQDSSRLKLVDFRLHT